MSGDIPGSDSIVFTPDVQLKLLGMPLDGLKPYGDEMCYIIQRNYSKSLL